MPDSDTSPPVSQPVPQSDHVATHPDACFKGKLIVAVHGMGDQTRNDFAQTIARLFSRYHLLTPANKGTNQTRLLPLGAWDGGRETPVDDPAVAFRPVPGCQELSDYAFAEVHWADIARSFETDGYRLEEATHWARSVVERLAQRHGSSTGLAPERFHLAGFVIEEIAETLALLQKMATVGQLFKITKKDIDKVLVQYLCDVQQVGDYRRQREKFRDRFFNRLEKLHEMYPLAEIHLIAHSEGTAVSLYSLLTALNHAGREEVTLMRKGRIDHDSLDLQPGGPRLPAWGWVGKVRSFSTLGSPIDKHLHLWPEMWETFDSHPGWIRPEEKIRMRNYYDYADPVGYELDSLRGKLTGWKCPAFQFDEEHDHGFRRYAMPGQAHLAYFTDDGLFKHLIENAVLDEGSKDLPKWSFAGAVGLCVPMAIVAALLFVAVFILHRSLFPGEHVAWGLGPLCGSWGLLVGTTVLARIQRLSRATDMLVLSMAIYLAGVALFRWGGGLCGDGAWLIAGSLIAVAAAWTVDEYTSRKRLPAVWSIRLMLLIGVGCVGFGVVAPRLGVKDQTATSLLGGLAAFSTLWWLGTLLFDLAFCWQRYINVEKSWIDKVLRT